MLKKKHSKKSIITTFGLVESTFYRELKRNSKKSVYNALYANMLAEERRKTGHYKTIFTSGMEKTVKDKLENHQWSPEQIVGWCKTRNIKMVSHERIYQFVLNDKLAGGILLNT